MLLRSTLVPCPYEHFVAILFIVLSKEDFRRMMSRCWMLLLLRFVSRRLLFVCCCNCSNMLIDSNWKMNISSRNGSQDTIASIWCFVFSRLLLRPLRTSASGHLITEWCPISGIENMVQSKFFFYETLEYKMSITYFWRCRWSMKLLPHICYMQHYDRWHKTRSMCYIGEHEDRGLFPILVCAFTFIWRGESQNFAVARPRTLASKLMDIQFKRDDKNLVVYRW